LLAKAFFAQVRLMTRSALQFQNLAADRHELMIPQLTMRPSIVLVSEQ